MHKYQDKAVEFALARPACNIFARPGKGKTRIALEIMASTSGRILIISPLFPAMTTWPRENEKWGYNFDMRLLHGAEKKEGREDVSIINYEGLLWLCEQSWVNEYTLIIYDEIHKMKAPGSRRFRKWRRLMPDFPYRLGLTGTPVGNKLLDLWAETYCIEAPDCSLGRTFSEFQQRYFLPHPYLRNVWTPQTDAENQIFDAIAPNALSLDFAADDEMPGLTHNGVFLELPDPVRRAYQDMKKDMMVHTDKGELVAAPNAAVASGKLRQIAAGKVYDVDGAVAELHKEKQVALRHIVEELQGDPVLIFFEFHHDLKGIRNALTGLYSSVPAIDGSTPAKSLSRIETRWNAGEIPVLAAHPKTAGSGVNLQDSGNTVIWYTMPWGLDVLEQGTGRVWRQGQKRSVMVHYLLVHDTIDEEVYDRVTRDKKAVQDNLYTRLTV
jgi:SNF2 family DNA or RNA helicase